MTIESQNLKLIPANTETLNAALAGDDALGKKLNVIVESGWNSFGDAPLQYVLDKLSQGENQNGWWTYFVIHKQDNKLIGCGGYKGLPAEDGTVEIGYEIAPAYRSRGYATEMANALMNNLRADDRVKSFSAHTLGEINHSTKVLQKCGFEKVQEINDPEDGVIWKWERKRKILDPNQTRSL